ncbi:MAG: ABC transporter ATP-binding protein [Planctomycetota bacterium]
MEASDPGSADHPLRRLLSYARPHRWRIRAAVGCTILNKILDIAPPALIGMAVDIVVEKEESFLAGLGIEDVTTQLWVLAGLTVLVWFAESLFDYAHKLLWRNLAQTVQHELRLDAYRHVQTLELAFFEDAQSGGLMAVLNDDVNQLERFLDVGATDLIKVSTTVVVIGAAFFYLAPSVAWMAMVPMPFILWGSVLYQRHLQPRYAAVRSEVGLLNSELAGNLGGIATIKSFAAEGREADRIRRRSEAYRESNRRAIRLSSAFSPLIRMVIVLGFAALVVFGGILAVEGELDVSAYTVMVFLTQRLLWPLTTLGETFDLYQRAMASTARVLDLLGRSPRVRTGATPLPLDGVRGEVEFDDVTFGYDEGYPVFRDLSLSVPAGSTVAIVGATGAGKSTIIKLLLRFYDAQRGRVRVDGIDVRELELDDLRRAIGLVSQDVFLFHGTVRENIAYGRPDADDDEIERASRIAEAHGFIEALPAGYDTLVGERGQKLSGGQRQRVSIARAVLKDPPLLVLDEATSAVDNETEAAIQRSLARIAVGRTTVVIAHRLSTVRRADRIYVLEGGHVSEWGTHDQLVEAGGVYAGLWRVQTGAAVVPGEAD